MDAHVSRRLRRPAFWMALAALTFSANLAVGAAYRTVNFTVDAPTPQLAKEIGDSAEQWRRELAIEWLGKELPRWSQPCPIKALVAPTLGAGGATSFVFNAGEVYDWRMNIQGSRERVLDSVLPHEITHTIFATHFRQPLPRWADEGACTTVEHRSEIDKQERMLIDFLKTKRGIPFDAMFAMTDYPRDVLPLYAQGHSLAQFLISQRGKQVFLNFLADGMRTSDWRQAIAAHYEYEHLLALQNSWMDWIRAGRPPIRPASGAMLASAQVATPEPPVAVPGVAAPRSHAAASPSVYGENTNWSPARPTRPVTAGYEPQAAAEPIQMSGSRESVWR
ncbi:MAG: hypothetical protein JNL18_08210 [Planctomycetaceae bacterium]|nr:hypothetical protein [Planctomycetaceae bacterium]